jgi:hypothetical protein
LPSDDEGRKTLFKAGRAITGPAGGKAARKSSISHDSGAVGIVEHCGQNQRAHRQPTVHAASSADDRAMMGGQDLKFRECGAPANMAPRQRAGPSVRSIIRPLLRLAAGASVLPANDRPKLRMNRT